MSAALQAALALAEQAAETGPDMSEATAGGGGGRLLPAGYAFARLVEYVEFGNQPQEYNGVAKPPKLEAQVGFALYDTGPNKYANDDGTPYVVRPYPFAVDRNEKAKAFKLFKVLNWKNDKKNFAQLLGQAFLVPIVHVAKSKTDATIVSRIDLDRILPPLDTVSGQPHPVPEARDADIRLFLWDYPTLQGWDALYIDGMWEAKDGKPARSKNTLQETILGATNFAGSPLEVLLKTSGRAVPSPVAAPALPQAGVAQGNAIPQATPAIPAVPSAALPSIPVPASVGAPASPTIPATTSPSNPAIPALPSIPGLPAIPAIPQ